VAYRVLDALLVFKKEKKAKIFIPNVETIQDIVENELIAANFIQTAKAYILYRKNRAEIRQKIGFVPERVKELVAESKKYFKNPLAEFVYYRTYARWIDEEGRRETWIETIDRYVNFMMENLGSKLTEHEYKEIREAILNQEVMPSMRLLQFAGKAARKTNICAYNCSFIAPKTFQDFGEIMYVSMCGTGVGWSVESENIQSLPQIKKQTGKTLPVYVIPDSKEGWADAFVFGLKTWFDGYDVTFDYSLIRPAGSILKTMGGKSSGPEPIRSLINFSREKILRRQGSHLSNLDAHDIICKIGECVVAGGVRRSAMISLSDLDDEAIRDSKKGQFYNTEAQRMLSNNSAVYNFKPPTPEFLDEWTALVKSGSGERGIFNRGGLAKTLPKRRLAQWKDGQFPAWGTNPCGEIILQSKQFCNLSEVVARASDTEATLLRKIRIATILGTYQASLTYFPYLSSEWKKNCENERLLGVSVTGQWDSKVARDPEVLKKLKDTVIETNKKYAKRFKISQSTCSTCVKPSGTVSQTVDCASGMHPRHAPYYIRRIRISATDALFKMLKDQGVPYYPEVGQKLEEATTFVLEFPVKAPEGAIFKNDLTALDQLEHWKIVKENYTEHNPSVTISVGEDEWIEVANWVYKNWDLVGGLSFLPRSNHVYQLAPYEEITKEKYEELLPTVADLDFSKIVTYEKVDDTDIKKELACASGLCEV
ncbi:MAG: ribonucleoside-triphosphate reductase, partial [Candidatus Pacebacteria bacterium]|nr:ribonucleoside-triphosphate reductase [Candidatus Paceibacterota bacterium]